MSTNMSPLESLPAELVYEVAYRLDEADLSSLRASSKTLQQKSNDLWVVLYCRRLRVPAVLAKLDTVLAILQDEETAARVEECTLNGFSRASSLSDESMQDVLGRFVNMVIKMPNARILTIHGLALDHCKTNRSIPVLDPHLTPDEFAIEVSNCTFAEKHIVQLLQGLDGYLDSLVFRGIGLVGSNWQTPLGYIRDNMDLNYFFAIELWYRWIATSTPHDVLPWAVENKPKPVHKAFRVKESPMLHHYSIKVGAATAYGEEGVKRGIDKMLEIMGPAEEEPAMESRSWMVG